LIQFSEESKRWVNATEYESLLFDKGVHKFMDVTDFDDAYARLATVPNADPIPTSPSHVDYVNQLIQTADVKRVVQTITTLADYHTRYFRSETGVQASQWLQHQYASLSNGRSDITAANFTYTNFPQISTIATIEGAGPHKDSIVIIGGHLDSVGSTSTGRSPGADDDASGTSTVLEVFRVLAASNYKPDYTLQFIGYAAEEGGLLGSQQIALKYSQDNVDVYSVLQFDMTGYGQESIGIVTDFTSSELNTFISTLVSTYTSLKQQNTQCGYGCSDHASWTKVGYRASFPFETIFSDDNPHIHSADDLLKYLNQDQLFEFVKLGLGYAVELAGVASQ